MLQFIGEILTPYTHIDDCPRNVNQNGPVCSLVLDKEFQGGLRGLEAGQKILILYWLDLTREYTIERKSPRYDTPRGVFSLRSPRRPNPIGAAELVIESIAENIVYIKGLDCVSGTKLLDIKPAMKGE